MTTPPIQYPNPAAALRAKLLSHATPENKTVVIDGTRYFIRTALLEDRQRVMDLAGMKVNAPKKKKGKKGEEEEPQSIDVPIDAMLASALVILAVDEVGNPIFTPADMEVLRKAPVGGPIERLARACLETINSDEDDTAGEE